MQKVISINKKTLNSEFFDEKTVKCLLKSEKDIENGRTKKATEVIQEFKAKYGF